MSKNDNTVAEIKEVDISYGIKLYTIHLKENFDLACRDSNHAERIMNELKDCLFLIDKEQGK